MPFTKHVFDAEHIFCCIDLHWSRHDNEHLESSIQLIIPAPCNFCWLKRLSTRRAPGLASQTQWTRQKPDRSSELRFWFHEEAYIITAALFMTCMCFFLHLKDQMTVGNIFLCLWLSFRAWDWFRCRGSRSECVIAPFSVCHGGDFGPASGEEGFTALKWLKTTKVKDGVSSTYTDRVWSLHTRGAL